MPSGRRSVLAFVPVLCIALWAGGCAGQGSPAGSIAQEEDLRVAGSSLLAAALRSEDPQRRARAARAIGRIQAPGEWRLLEPLVADEVEEVRLAALFALGQFGLVAGRAVDAGAFELARRALEDPSPAAVARALEALGKLSVEVAEEPLPFLNHAEPAIREQAALALFRGRFAPLWRKQTETPPPFTAAAVEALRAALHDPEGDVRFAAAFSFSRYPEPRARRALVEALTDRNELVRLFAVRGLGLVGDESTSPYLIARLHDDSHAVRTEAVKALSGLGLHEALRGARNDPSAHVRRATAAGLGDAGSAASFDDLKALLEDPSTMVRVAAIEALSKRLGPAAVDRLAEWAVDPDWRIRAAAARVAAGAGAVAGSWVERLFEDPDRRVAAALVAALDDPSYGDELLVRALRDDDLAVRGSAVPRVAERESLDRAALLREAFEASPGNEWIEVRETIAEELVRVDPAEAVPAPRAEIVPSPWLDVTFDARPVVEMVTDRGSMTIELFHDDAPLHVASFLERVDAGFYDGLIWHRVVSNFVIQGGDPRGDGWGSGGVTLRDEIHPRRYERGTVGMPKAGKDTGGCQLFITHVPTPRLDGNYTVFGQVIAGLETIDAIEVGDAIVSIRRIR